MSRWFSETWIMGQGSNNSEVDQHGSSDKWLGLGCVWKVLLKNSLKDWMWDVRERGGTDDSGIFGLSKWKD